MPTRRVSCQQQYSSSSSVESPPSDSNSVCLTPERYFGSVDARGSQCRQEAETMPNKMAASEQPSCSSSVDSPPSDSNCSSRYYRNLAEKQRRDKLNGYITELATLVPMVSMTTRRLDKTSILRLSAAYLRIYQSKLNPNRCEKLSWGPNILNCEHLNELLQASGGFLLIASFPEKIIYASPNIETVLGQQNERLLGKIIYVSPNVEKILGQQNIDMIGQSLFHFVHPDDVKYVLEKLKLTAQTSNNRSSPTCRNVFCARMKERSMPRSEAVNYQLMHFSCSQDIDDDIQLCERKSSIIKRNKSSGLEVKNDILITSFIKPVTVNPLNELSITEAFQEEYVTRHGVDGKILFADHRISTITGHLPHEVHGMSAYEYIVEKDIPIAALAHKRMFSSIDGTGMIVYRLRTATQTAVYLKSIGHLQFDKSSTKVQQFICINKLLSEEEGEKELQKFVEHYTPLVNSGSPAVNPILSGINSSEVPSLLETTFNSEVRSPVPHPVSSPTHGSSHLVLQSCSSYSRSEPCSTIPLPSPNPKLPAGIQATNENGDNSLSPCTFSPGAVHSPNSISDFDSSIYAQHSEKNDLLLQEDGSFSNGYYAIAAAFCPKMPSEHCLCVPHSTDMTDGYASLQHCINKRKRSLETAYNGSHSREINSAEDFAKSKYTKFSAEPCDIFERGGNIRTIGIPEKNCQSSLNDDFSHKVLHGRCHTQIKNILSSFSSAPEKEVCGTELQDYLRSPDGNDMDHFESNGASGERQSAESPPEGTASASANSRKVDMGWRLNDEDTAPSIARINHVQTSHFNGCILPDVEYQDGTNSVVQNFTVDHTEEWLNDSFSGLTHGGGKY